MVSLQIPIPKPKTHSGCSMWKLGNLGNIWKRHFWHFCEHKSANWSYLVAHPGRPWPRRKSAKRTTHCHRNLKRERIDCVCKISTSQISPSKCVFLCLSSFPEKLPARLFLTNQKGSDVVINFNSFLSVKYKCLCSHFCTLRKRQVRIGKFELLKGLSKTFEKPLKYINVIRSAMGCQQIESHISRDLEIQTMNEDYDKCIRTLFVCWSLQLQ